LQGLGVKAAVKSVTLEEKRAALDRVLRSDTFARSAQLKKFLEYVCAMEMADRVAEISEYSIAVEALGRHADYSPGNDSTVRGRAHDLRLKLEQFYTSESPGESIRITFPRGAYAVSYTHLDVYKRQVRDASQNGPLGLLGPTRLIDD